MYLKWESDDKKSFVLVNGSNCRNLICQMKFGPASEYFQDYCSSEAQAAQWFSRMVDRVKKARNLPQGDAL